MALVDRIAADVTRVFMQFDHFAETHYWNGKEIICVVDEEAAIKRKNNNVNDISWQENTREKLVYTPVATFPDKPEPNTQVIFDERTMRIREVNEDMGVYSIRLTSFDPREVY